MRSGHISLDVPKRALPFTQRKSLERRKDSLVEKTTGVGIGAKATFQLNVSPRCKVSFSKLPLGVIRVGEKDKSGTGLRAL